MARKITYTTSARRPDRRRADLLSEAASLFNAGKVADADRAYAAILATDPDTVGALVGKALTGTRLRGDIAEALDLLDRAASLAPKDSHIPQSRATILNEAGDFDGAVSAARLALSLDPGCALAYLNLTDATRIAPGDSIFDMGEAALGTAGLSDTDRIAIHFALGKAHQDCGDWDRAFAHFSAGNDLKPARPASDPGPTIAARQKELFAPEVCRTLTGAARTRPRPIFIIGMPRSGTTLLERMLAAHPKVSTVGERSEINHLSRDFYAKAQATASKGTPAQQAIRAAMTPTNLGAIARAYLNAVATGTDAHSHNIIDKMPTNFWNLGLIAATFADTPILHLRRHPLDTCLSNYLANFYDNLDYSNRLSTLGAYFRLYDDLMRYWDSVFPGRITQINYEDLVTAPENEARRVLSACGLDWHEGCLHPDQTQGIVATASLWQARQKISTGSVEKWRRYEAHLGPLIDALGGADWISDYEADRRKA